jgi:hypothetical protein
MNALKTATAGLLLGAALGIAAMPAFVHAAGATEVQVAQKKTNWKGLTPSQAASQLKAKTKRRSTVKQVYGECYPSSGGEDCSEFLSICIGVGGGAGQLPGGGYSCDYRED